MNKQPICVRSFRSVGLSLAWLLVMCTSMRYVPPRVEPVIRVGILQDVESLVLKTDDRVQGFALKPNQSFQAEEKGSWLVSLSQAQPAKIVYRCLLYESDDRNKAEGKAAEWRKKGKAVDIIVRGDELKAGSRTIVDHRSYAVVLAQTFAGQAEAEEQLIEFPGITGRVMRQIITPASGRICLLSPGKKSLTIDNCLRLAGTPITIEKVSVGTGFHWQHDEERTYGGELEISLSPQGKLTVVNVLPLEQYLVGVVAGEMPATFPLEALKAQAIVSRTVLLRHFGRVHRDDDFDVCADVHCQVFAGMSKNSGAIENAVYATRGLAITYHDQLCDASYSAVCGGHTENAADVWEGAETPYLRGRLDTFERLPEFDLRREDKSRLWIESEPNVCCHLPSAADVSFARYAEKYFRWQQSYRREELEKIISEKTGYHFGQLQDIVPIRRGLSGRIKELKIIGSEKTFIITKELNIRRALSPTALYSSCFVVDKADLVNNLPNRFIFKGAGWGHGVGMCQIGAAMRAYQGQRVSQILAAYYDGIEIQQLY